MRDDRVDLRRGLGLAEHGLARPRAPGALPVETKLSHRRTSRRNAASAQVRPHAGEGATSCRHAVGADVARGARRLRRRARSRARSRCPRASRGSEAPPRGPSCAARRVSTASMNARSSGSNGDAGFHAAREARLRRQPLEVVEAEARGKRVHVRLVGRRLDVRVHDVALGRGAQSGAEVGEIVAVGAGGDRIRRRVADARIQIRSCSSSSDRRGSHDSGRRPARRRRAARAASPCARGVRLDARARRRRYCRSRRVIHRDRASREYRHATCASVIESTPPLTAIASRSCRSRTATRRASVSPPGSAAFIRRPLGGRECGGRGGSFFGTLERASRGSCARPPARAQPGRRTRRRPARPLPCARRRDARRP